MRLQEIQNLAQAKWKKVYVLFMYKKSAHLVDGRMVHCIEVDKSLIHMAQDVFLLQLGDEHSRWHGYDLAALDSLIDWSKHDHPQV